MMANEQTSPLLEMHDILGEREGDNEESESEEEKQVPQFSMHWEAAKYRWPQLKKTIMVLLLNIIAFGLARIQVSSSKRWWYFGNIEPSPESIRSMFTASFGIYVVIFLVDAYLCFHCARFFEEQMMMQEEEQIGTARKDTSDGATRQTRNHSTAQEQKPLNFIAISKSTDELFGCEAPSSTFLIALLYALFAMAVWGAAISTAGLVYFQVASDTNNLAQCYWQPMTRSYAQSYPPSSEDTEISALQELPNFQNLPSEVQNWIKSASLKHLHVRTRNRTGVEPTPIDVTLPYVQLIDGSVAIPYLRDASFDRNLGVARVALNASNGSTIVEYPFNASYGTSAQGIKLVGFPRLAPYQGWCGVSESGIPSIVQEEALCYQNGVLMHFPGVKQGQERNGWSDTIFFASDDTLWVAKRHEIFKREKGFHGLEHSEVLLSLASYCLSTKEHTMVLERKHAGKSVNRNEHRPLVIIRGCHWPWVTFIRTSIPVLMLLSIYLYRQDISSSLVPVSIAMYLVMGCFLLSPWPSVGALLVASFCTCLMVTEWETKGGQYQTIILKYVSTAMLVWAQYSLLGSVLAGFLLSEWTLTYWPDIMFGFVQIAHIVLVPCLTLLVAVVNGVCLNHPIFELLACAFSMLALGTIPMCFFKGPLYMVLPPLFLTLCLGCVGISRVYHKNRLRAKVYCRRAWRHLKRVNGKRQ
jgi:hypothetical protein